MSKPEEDLKAILDLLAEWGKENGLGNVNANVYPDGFATAYAYNEDGIFLYHIFEHYENMETQGGDLDGKEQSS